MLPLRSARRQPVTCARQWCRGECRRYFFDQRLRGARFRVLREARGSHPGESGRLWNASFDQRHAIVMKTPRIISQKTASFCPVSPRHFALNVEE